MAFDSTAMADRVLSDGLGALVPERNYDVLAERIARALAVAYAAGVAEAAWTVARQPYPRGGHNDEWHGAMLMRDYCESAIRALIPPSPGEGWQDV